MPADSVVYLDLAEATLALQQIEGHVAALHNHIASAVESPHHWTPPLDAKALVKELRQYETLATRLRAVVRPVKL